MSTTKERLTGVAGTVGIHALVLLFLFFYYITPNLSRSSEELEGVPVMFGNVPDAGGDDEPSGRGDGTAPNQETVSTPKETAKPVAEEVKPVKNTQPTPALTQRTPSKAQGENVHSQDNEQTVAMAAEKRAAAEKRRQEAVETERIRREQAAAQRAAQEQAQRSAAIKNQTSGLFGNGSGTQGVPTGNSNHGKTSGVGGFGSYDLGGRGVGRGGLVQPNYNVDDYGTVVVDIVVDPRGDVKEASIGKGTNTDNGSLRNEALRAAKRTKFEPANVSGNQKGTIKYTFNLR
jgi:TonB family protein